MRGQPDPNATFSGSTPQVIEIKAQTHTANVDRTHNLQASWILEESTVAAEPAPLLIGRRKNTQDEVLIPIPDSPQSRF
jgi:hypothetical protein